MKNYAISIIIPVYNAEKYIDRCLNSIVQQTIFGELQVIIIDDGSIDNSLQNILGYQKQYSNIQVISIENAGVSNARNIGIEKAVGKYITFVDADDWVDLDCYEKMYKKGLETSADIVAAGFYINDDKGDVLKCCVADRLKVRMKKESMQDFLCGVVDVHCYNKLFKTELLENIRFDTNFKIAEDRLFLFETLATVQSICLMPDVFYHYYQNENSTMHKQSIKTNMDGVLVSKIILSKTDSYFADLRPYAEAMYISMACRIYCEFCSRNEKESEDFHTLKNDVKQYNIVRAVRYMSVKHGIALLLAKISPKIFNKLRNNTYVRFVK